MWSIVKDLSRRFCHKCCANSKGNTSSNACLEDGNMEQRDSCDVQLLDSPMLFHNFIKAVEEYIMANVT